MNKSKQLFINLITTLITLIVNIGLSFGLSRYVVDSIGEEAYGFVSLANNFVMYATILTIALNSMASRFVTINLHKGKTEEANKYFSSVLIANVIIVIALIIPSIVLIGFLENIVNISQDLIIDVKLLFTFIILNFFVSLVSGVFAIATYCTNKVYLSSIKNMESLILKAIVIVALFILFKPAVFYVGFATLLSGVFVALYNVKYTKQLLPEIKIKKENFSIPKIKELIFSGIWNSITNLGNVLADGLDLLISNLAISPSTMGIVALAKTPGTALNTVISSIANVFQPQIIGFYAKDDIDGVLRETKQGMKITGVFGNIPFAYIIVFGAFFCKVWMPDVENQLLYSLCVLTFINIFCGGISNPLYNIFTITNKLKGNAILNVASGLISTLLVFILLKTTTLGVYAIVGVSAIIGIIKSFLIIPIYVSQCLKIDWKFFLFPILRYCLSTLIMIACFALISKIFTVTNWLHLLISICVCGVMGLVVNYMVLFNKEDRKRFIDIFLNKLKNRKVEV